MTAPRRLRVLWRAAGFLIVSAIAAYAAHRTVAVRHGLNAVYYAGTGWHDDRGGTSFVGDEVSTTRLKQRRPDFADHPFSVEWRGFIAIPRTGTITIRAVSDDGSWVFLDGKELVSNGGVHPATAADGRVRLEAGVYPLFIHYFQDRGDCAFELHWSRDGGRFERVPSWALLTDKASIGRVRLERGAQLAFIGFAIGTYGAIAMLAVTFLARAAAGLFTVPPRDRAALRWVLAGSLVLNAWGITWGMPNLRGWAPDEVVPPDVIRAVEARFSRGWHEKYPPFHYAVLAAADSPILLLSSLDGVDVHRTAVRVSLALIGRLVSLAFAAATIVVVYLCGLQLYGPTGAAFAAAITALTVPFAYYSKLANLDVPYLFWFALSLLAYIRILQRHERRDYLLFAVSAVLAGCTKDQAWGLYFATPFAILIARWRTKRESDGSLVRVLFNATTIQAFAIAVVTLLIADAVILNFSGFVAHVKLLLGTPAPFQEFPRTVRGELQMAWRAAQEMRYMAGWPLAVILAVSLARGLFGRTTTPSLRWLLVPALSYYASFVGVILFYFDRYFLPITMVLALFAGWWLERFVAPGVSARRTRLTLVAAALAYTAMYAANVNYVMTFDSRYSVTRWLEAHAGGERVIASPGPLEYSMLAGDFRWQRVESVAEVAALRPAFIVLSPDLLPNVDSRVGTLWRSLRGGENGYRLALSVRTSPLPLPGLHPDLDEHPRHGPEFSDLAMINPRMEIYERVR